MKFLSFFLLATSLVAAIPVPIDLPTSSSLTAIEEGGIITPAPVHVLLDERSPAKKKKGHGGAFGKDNQATDSKDTKATDSKDTKATDSKDSKSTSDAAQYKSAGLPSAGVTAPDSKKLSTDDIKRAMDMAVKLETSGKKYPGVAANGAKPAFYPHHFNNKNTQDGTVVPNVPKNLIEYPVLQSSSWAGGNPGAYRIVYTKDTNTKVLTYRGTISHIKTDKGLDDFEQCT